MSISSKTILSIALGILFLNVSFLLGQENVEFAKKGTKELGGSISFQNITSQGNGASISLLSVQPYYGTFISNGSELGITPILTILSSGGQTVTEYGGFLSPSYNFNIGSKVYPFIGALVGFTWTSSSGSMNSSVTSTWGVRGGLKILITNQGLLNIGLQYTKSSTVNVHATGTNQLLFTVGFTVWY